MSTPSVSTEQRPDGPGYMVVMVWQGYEVAVRNDFEQNRMLAIIRDGWRFTRGEMDALGFSTRLPGGEWEWKPEMTSFN